MRSLPGHPRSAVVVVLAISSLSALAGCYTVLKHPPTADVTEGGESRRDCYDCHSDSGPAHRYDPLVAPGFGYLDDQWYGWYAYPWWYRNYWYWDRHNHAESPGGGIPARGDNPDDGRRHIGGRGGFLYPDPPAMPPIMSSPTAGGGSGSGGGGGGTTSPAGEKDQKSNGREMKSGQSSPGNQNQGGGDKDKNKDKKDDGSKKERNDKNDGRNVWKRGG